MEGQSGGRRSRIEETISKMQSMKLKLTLGGIIAALVLATAPASLLAQSCPGGGPNGKGYGGPPKTEEERAARQAACQEKNGGVCPKGGPQANCTLGGKGQGKGAGKGVCDGTGPRAGKGAGLAKKSGQAQK